VEPAVDKAKENEEEKESRTELLVIDLQGFCWHRTSTGSFSVLHMDFQTLADDLLNNEIQNVINGCLCCKPRGQGGDEAAVGCRSQDLGVPFISMLCMVCFLGGCQLVQCGIKTEHRGAASSGRGAARSHVNTI